MKKGSINSIKIFLEEILKRLLVLYLYPCYAGCEQVVRVMQYRSARLHIIIAQGLNHEISRLGSLANEHQTIWETLMSMTINVSEV